MKEEPIGLELGGNVIRGYLHVPGGEWRANRTRAGVLVCYPFAEERKRSYRLFVDFSRMLVDRGIHVVRFDFRGTGESDGEFGDFTVSDYIEDTKCVLNYAVSRLRLDFLCVVGLRLGASIGVLACRDDSRVDALCLWQPVIDMGEYFVELMGKGGFKSFPGSDFCDLKGYAFTKISYLEGQKYETLDRVRFADSEISLSLFEVNEGGHSSASYEALAGKWNSRGRTVHHTLIRGRSFWDSIGLSLCPDLLDQSADWIVSVLALRGC